MGTQNYQNKFNNMDDIRDKIAVLLGKTGDGKSSFINSITQKDECKIGSDEKACTQKISHVESNKNGKNFYFVDTPGLDDGKGDEKNIEQLGNLKKSYPRINTFIICIKLNELRFSNSVKYALMKFMEIFPTEKFWEHVLIVRSYSIRGRRFETMKVNSQGKLLKGILDDKDLNDFMKKNKIIIPTNLKEFYVDSVPYDLDEETLSEFENIFTEISKMHPIYKDVKEEIKEYTNEEKQGLSTFIHIKTLKHIKFIDFDDKEHETSLLIGEEIYNLDGVKPVLVDVKREQGKEPRGSYLCYKYQFWTTYNLIKFYEIEGDRKRVQCELDSGWEYNTKDGEENGEKKRNRLYNENTGNQCSC